MRAESPPRSLRLLCLCCLSVALGCPPGDGESAGSATSTETDTEGAGEPVRYSTLSTYLPLVGPPQEVSEDPADDGYTLTVEVGGEVHSGAYDGASWIDFTGVPAGPFVLRTKSPPSSALPGLPGGQSFTETALRELFVGRTFSGRAEVALTTGAATSIALTVKSMTPFGDADLFELYSYNADAWRPVDPLEGAGAPLPGDTSLVAWTFPWDAATTRGDGSPLVDPRAGDDLWLTHLVGAPLIAAPDPEEWDDPWIYATVHRLIEAAPLVHAPMIDGQTTAASGAFAPVALTPLTIDLRTSEFLAEVAASVPAAELFECSALVFVEPGVDAPVYGLVPTLVNVEVSDARAPGDRVLSLDYGDPFPIGTETLYVRCTGWVWIPHPVTGETDPVAAYVDVGWPVAELDGGPIRPSLGAPRDLAVNGDLLAVGQLRAGVGATPTITFSPPSIGAPDRYVLTVSRVDDVIDPVNGVLSRRRRVAAIVTEGTSVTVPAGILEAGGYYYVQVGAGDALKVGAGRPYRHRSGFAAAISGYFTP